MSTAHRKADHLRINLGQNVQAKGVGAGFDRFRFVHDALPELDLERVTTETELFGKSTAAPVLISCMTGGTSQARSINVALAEAAAELGIPMGLGSGRALLEDERVRTSFDVRHLAPDVPLLANLGAAQLRHGVGVAGAQRLVDVLSADALVIHLNALQEALQADGSARFHGVLDSIAETCARLDRPVVVKEVGWGLAPDVVRSLLDAGVAAVDVAGTGGTSWSEVERHRLPGGWRQRVAAAFAGWGIPTASAIAGARAVAPDALIFGSGGIRDGVDAAKAVALGADFVGIAGPFLHAATAGSAAAVEFGAEIITTLRLVMFAVGAASLDELRETPRLIAVDGPLPGLSGAVAGP